MKYFLVGFMASGKTKWGKKLAQYLDIPFIDMDRLIEEKTGMTIPEFFEKYGESAFREKERDVLQSADLPNDVIVSCGGGTPCYFDNMDWMNQNGKTIYIQQPEEILTDRILNSKTERPLAKGKSREELLVFVKQKMQERSPFYEKAQRKIVGPEHTIEEFIFQAEIAQKNDQKNT